jgi:YggT family protein
MILPVATVGEALGELIFFVEILVFVYVLLDLARNFVKDIPAGVLTFHRALGQVFEPIFRPIRNALPDLGGIDFSPLIVILVLQALRTLVS